MDAPLLDFPYIDPTQKNEIYRDKLVSLLSNDLDFHNKNSGYSSHNFHSFPAKFPPQLPRKFIEGLTNPFDVVLDPMMGSGTTIVEAFLTGRRAIGIDIDYLALLISIVKVTPFNRNELYTIGNKIIDNARDLANNKRNQLNKLFVEKWDPLTKQFINYWFSYETQIELLSIITQIEKLSDPKIRAFFEVVFSAIIITKSGGVSLALDLAHTRPHRAKMVITKTEKFILNENLEDISPHRLKVLTKILRSALEEFDKRFKQNLESMVQVAAENIKPFIIAGNSQILPLRNDSVDLIVTSPPYASNAIDYMRAHKFSLVWMGYPVGNLSKKRKEYIGGDDTINVYFEEIPENVKEVVATIGRLDKKKSHVLHRYYSEMSRSLRQMFRVLKPGKAAIVVVGNSTMRGIDTETHNCLAEIGRMVGFEVPKIGIRKLDRNRRMLPAGIKINVNSQIQQRMHEEYVIGFYKP
ncbi:MAG: hypothetical protein FJ121_07505 [Deltaproteobacteria bacterium]|nr:hypothetical protein [Deltaproteobacteria bacterium]